MTEPRGKVEGRVVILIGARCQGEAMEPEKPLSVSSEAGVCR